jgi:hypothetical protein
MVAANLGLASTKSQTTLAQEVLKGCFHDIVHFSLNLGATFSELQVPSSEAG